MSIINKLVGSKTSNRDANKLDLQELTFILNVMKSTTITGDQVELFYNMVLKLQNQYTNELANQEK